jgi:uncharacterized protein (TIGR02466 family)
MMDVILEFATPVGMFYAEDENLKKPISDNIFKIINNSNEDVLHFINQSKTTPDNLNTREEFKDLICFVEKNVERFTEEILGIKKTDLSLTAMWSNVHASGSKHHYHQHPNSFLSGVYYPYVSTCEDAGNIVFVDPRQAKNMFYADFIKSSCISNRNIWVTPKTGLLLLFPSWLEHGTEPYICSSGNQRVSISFNYRLNSCSTKTMRISNDI